MASTKVNVSLPPELVIRMDEFSKKNSISRSGLVALAVSQYLNAFEMKPAVNKILNQFAAVMEGTIKSEISQEEADERMKRIEASLKDIEKEAETKGLK